MPDRTTAGRFAQLRWRTFAILVVAYMTVFFHRMAPGVVAGDLMVTFQVSGAALGSLAAMYYYIYTAMQIPAGVLADTLGSRSVVTLGGIVAGCGSILFGLAPDFELAASGRFLVGLGVSVVFVGLMRSNTQWFRARDYGAISGITLLLGNLGAILAAGPLALVLGVLSWRTVFVSIGILSLFIALLTAWLVRDQPEAVGLPSVRELDGLPAHPSRQRHWRHELWDVLTTAAIWPTFFVMCGGTGSLFAFAGLWGVPLLVDSFGLTRSAASLYTTVTLSGFAVSSLLSGWLSDRVGRRQPFLLGASALSVLMWLGLIVLPWTPGWSGLLLYGGLGIAAGGFVVGYAVAKEVVAPQAAGMAIALVNTGLFLGAALLQPAFGWILDLSWDGALRDGMRLYTLSDYHGGLWLTSGFALCGFIAATRGRETRCQQRPPAAD
ncbi:MFS transporter [Chromatium okenii]|uniref:MFS transporter n=1 Tax=Chromatium okenii TaxID=61644 RepID=UPI00190695E8|nr:MFS transporter [Chromatium okenii]MBK1641633.1 MFS transporter [Chromatium okenii]